MMTTQSNWRVCGQCGLLATILALGSVTTRAATVIHAGWLFDADSARMLTQQTLVVDDGRIVTRSPGYAAPAAADTLIDLRDATVMPGWIDMHVHIASELSPTAYADRFRLEPADAALQGSLYARRTLQAGFTTVRDLGTANHIAQ